MNHIVFAQAVVDQLQKFAVFVGVLFDSANDSIAARQHREKLSGGCFF